MLSYQIHSIETAPDKSKPLLELFTHAVGFVPNLAGAIANSPVLANSLLGLFQNVHGGSFTEAEVQVLLLTNAVTNSSGWPVAFHTALGLKQGIDPADIQAIRERQLPKQKRYAAAGGSFAGARLAWVVAPESLALKRDRETLAAVTVVVGRVFRGPNSKSRIFTCEVIVRL